jgi:hypothetical protein
MNGVRPFDCVDDFFLFAEICRNITTATTEEYVGILLSATYLRDDGMYYVSLIVFRKSAICLFYTINITLESLFTPSDRHDDAREKMFS